jgi:hypothetical protein
LTSLLILYFSYNHCFNDITQDAYAIAAIIQENHPGIYNTEDVIFKITFEQGFKKVIHTLKTMHHYDEGFIYLEKWINSFDDPHLRIRKIIAKNHEQTNNTNQNRQATNQLERYEWSPDTVYIKIPTFQLSPEEQEQLKKIITIKPAMRNAKHIIFDVRGNGGGSSLWAQKITNALFGPEYMKQRRYLYEKDTVIDWRASKGNADYFNSIAPIIKEQFGKSSSEYAIITTICNGLEEAIKNNQPFYTQKLQDMYNPVVLQKKTVSLCKADIFILIDEKCASATLSFIDELKSVENKCTLIGTPTAYDTEYMECRSEKLPSGKARLIFPTKMYHNRYRKNRQPYLPDIYYDLNKKSNAELKQWFLEHVFMLK